jgi:dUTP pyrophosphatase
MKINYGGYPSDFMASEDVQYPVDVEPEEFPDDQVLFYTARSSVEENNFNPLKIFRISEKAKLPTLGTPNSACLDLSFCGHSRRLRVYDPYGDNFDRNIDPIDGSFKIHPRERVMVSTGLIFDIFPGYYVAVFSRSGLALKKGLRLVNSVGIVDSDYREEAFVLLINDTSATQRIEEGERIAQMQIISHLPQVATEIFYRPGKVEGRNGGFGSTGS